MNFVHVRALIASSLLALALSACGDASQRDGTPKATSGSVYDAGGEAGAVHARSAREEQDTAATREAQAAAEMPRTGNKTYTVSIASLSGTTFSVTKAKSGQVRRECSAPRAGGCLVDGTW